MTKVGRWKHVAWVKIVNLSKRVSEDSWGISFYPCCPNSCPHMGAACHCACSNNTSTDCSRPTNVHSKLLENGRNEPGDVVLHWLMRGRNIGQNHTAWDSLIFAGYFWDQQEPARYPWLLVCVPVDRWIDLIKHIPSHHGNRCWHSGMVVSQVQISWEEKQLTICQQFKIHFLPRLLLASLCL